MKCIIIKSSSCKIDQFIILYTDTDTDTDTDVDFDTDLQKDNNNIIYYSTS